MRSRQKIRQTNHNQNVHQENNNSIHMVERPQPAVPSLQPVSRNEPELYPGLNNQSEHLVGIP